MTSLGSERPRRHLIHRILSEHTDHGQVESFHPSVWTSAHHKFTKERFFPEHDEPAVHERSEDCVAGSGVIPGENHSKILPAPSLLMLAIGRRCISPA